MKRVALVLLGLILLTTVSCMTQVPVSDNESMVSSTTTAGTQSASMTTASTQTTSATKAKPEAVVTTASTSRAKSTTSTTKTALKPRTTIRTKSPTTTATTKSTTPPTRPTETVKPKELTLQEAYDYYKYSLYNAFMSEKYSETINELYFTNDNQYFWENISTINIYDKLYQHDFQYEDKTDNNRYSMYLFFSGDTLYYREDDLENGTYNIAFRSTLSQFENDFTTRDFQDVSDDFTVADVQSFTISEKDNSIVMEFKLKHVVKQQVIVDLQYITGDANAKLQKSSADYSIKVVIDKKTNQVSSMTKEFTVACIINQVVDNLTYRFAMEMKTLTKIPSMSYVPDWAAKEISPRPDWVG